MWTETVTPDFAAQLELAEVAAWLDLYVALPTEFAQRFELELIHVGGVVLTRCPTIPFVHFNCALNLGLPLPASETDVDAVIKAYRQANVREFAFFHTPHCQPAQLAEWFTARGLRIRGGWDRIYRNNTPLKFLDSQVPALTQVEQVTRDTAHEWATFIDDQYGLPTKPWLLALVGRPGWRHYVLRQNGAIVAVRSVYIHPEGAAWLGIEAPVPGVMAPSYDLDVHLCHAIVKDGLASGVRYFVADIEAPTSAMDTPAYHHFGALGFRRAYFRSHYAY